MEAYLIKAVMSLTKKMKDVRIKAVNEPTSTYSPNNSRTPSKSAMLPVDAAAL
jgi:hypothetical protein